MQVLCYPPFWQMHSDLRDFSNGVCRVMKITVPESNPDMLVCLNVLLLLLLLLLVVVVVVVMVVTAVCFPDCNYACRY